MKINDWKTTIGGILLAADVAAAIMGYIPHQAAEAIAGGLVSAGLIAAKDGGTPPTIPPATQ